MRKVTASFEPVQLRVWKQGQCPPRLPRKTDLVLASPTDHEPCVDAAAGRAFLFPAIGQLTQQLVKGWCLRIAAHFFKDDCGIERPRPSGELRQQDAACQPAGGDGRHNRLQHAHRANREPHRGEECVALPTAPEASRVKGNHTPEHAAATRQLKDESGAHRAANRVHAAQALRVDERGDCIAQGVNRSFTEQRRRGPEARKVYGNDVVACGQWSPDGGPGPGATAQTVD
ncbi:hypothetical protein RFUL19S_00663 [Rhizobacter fulvus]